MITDAKLDFGLPAITDSNAGTASTNVLDMGSAKVLFAAGPKYAPRLFARAPVSAACTGVRVDVVGSDAAALNSGNVVISSHRTTVDERGAALGSGTQNVQVDFQVMGQSTAKRYYGLLVYLEGTNPDMTAGDAYIVADAQSNMVGP